jgi:hypothetical protein
MNVSLRAEQWVVGALVLLFGVVVTAGVLFVATIPLWCLAAALGLIAAGGAAGAVRATGNTPGVALLRGRSAHRLPPPPEEPPPPQSGRGHQATLREAAEILGGLLPQGGLDPTFLRMVSWYRELTDELGCRDAFEQVLMTVLVWAAEPAPDREAAGTAEHTRQDAG